MSYASDVAVRPKVLSDQYVRGWVYNGSHIGVERGVVGSRVTIGPMQWLYIFYPVGKTLITEEEGLFLRMQSFHLMPRRYSLSHHIGEL